MEDGFTKHGVVSIKSRLITKGYIIVWKDWTDSGVRSYLGHSRCLSGILL